MADKKPLNVVVVVQDRNLKFALLTVCAHSSGEAKLSVNRTVQEQAYSMYSLTERKWVKQREREDHPLVRSLENLIINFGSALPIAEVVQVGPEPWNIAYQHINTGFYCGPVKGN